MHRFILVVLASLSSSLFAQNQTVFKNKPTNRLLEGFKVPSGVTITVESGGTLTVDAGATVTGITATVADGSITSAKIADGTITNADISASAVIALSKLAVGNSTGGANTNDAGKLVIFGSDGSINVSSASGAGLISTVSSSATAGVAAVLSGSTTAKAFHASQLSSGETAFYATGSSSAGGITLHNGTSNTFVLGMDGNITTGTFSGTLGAISGASLTSLNASNISSGTLNAARLPASGVTAASYTSANITVDAAGRVTAASNGSGGGGGSSWTVKTANYTAAAGDKIVADTTAGSFAITLPDAPANGTTIEVAAGSNWSANALTIDTAGTEMINNADPVSLSDPSYVVVVYDSTLTGWRMYRASYGGAILSATDTNAALLIGSSNQVIATDGTDINIGSGTGTKFGTGSTQKIAFFGQTPTTQPSAIGTANTSHSMSGGDTIDAGALNTALDALGTKINAIEALLQSLGLMAP